MTTNNIDKFVSAGFKRATTFLFREGNRLLGRNAGTESSHESKAGDNAARVIQPFHQQLSFTKRGYGVIVAGVSHLIYSRGPLTIARRVRAIVIFAIKAQAGLLAGWLTPIKTLTERPRLKGIVRKSPLIANKNPAPSVAMKIAVLRIMAAINHRPPNRIQAIPNGVFPSSHTSPPRDSQPEVRGNQGWSVWLSELSATRFLSPVSILTQKEVFDLWP